MNDFLGAYRGIVVSVDVGGGGIIDVKIIANGSQQYKVRNSKGGIFYITANSVYIQMQ